MTFSNFDTFLSVLPQSISLGRPFSKGWFAKNNFRTYISLKSSGFCSIMTLTTIGAPLLPNYFTSKTFPYDPALIKP